MPFRRHHVLIALTGSIALGLAAPAAQPAIGAPRADAPDPHARAGWWAFARGDEALSVAIDPLDGRLWEGTEGGGVVVWDTTGRTFQQHLFPNQPGLRSNTVYDIAFDPRNGDAWLATANGLTHVARATGWWTAYTPPSLAPSTPSAEVEIVPDGLPPFRVWSAVAVAPDGTLWAGVPEADRALDVSDASTLKTLSPDGGVVRRTPDGRWTWFPFHPDLEAGPRRSTVADLAVLGDGRIVIAHGRRGNTDVALTLYDPRTDRWSAIESVGPVGDVAKGPRTGQVMQLAVTPEPGGGESLWLATWSRGVYRWRDGRWSAFGRDGGAAEPSAGLCGDQVWAIAAAPDAVWVSCAARSGEDGAGVSRYDRVADAWRSIGTADGLPTGIVTAIAARPGGAFLGTDEPTTRHTGGIGVVPLRTDGGAPIIDAPLSTAVDGRTPAANETTAIVTDPQGRLWVGTRGAGLLGWDPRDGRWRQWTTASTGGALPGDAVGAVAVRGDHLWIASTRTRQGDGEDVDGGLAELDRATGAIVRTLRPAPGGLPSGQPSSLAVAADGRLFIGLGSASGGVGVDVHQGEGLAAFDPESNTWTIWDHSNGLGGDTVLGLAATPDAVWAALSYATDHSAAAKRVGGGVGALEAAQWRTWRTDDFGLNGFREESITGDVRAIAAGADGSVWAGTYRVDGKVVGHWPLVDATVNRYDPLSRAWRSATFPGDGWVAAIAHDSAGRVWLGTTRGLSGEFWRADEVRGDRDATMDKHDLAEGGIWLGRRIDGAWERLTGDDSGLPSRSVAALAVDESNGHVWVGTSDAGVAVFAGEEPYGPTDPGRPIGRDRSRLTYHVWLPAVQR
ncbi:MAG: two-component regulator propeller domain-containing protein [Ardenticatenales bacterium]